MLGVLGLADRGTWHGSNPQAAIHWKRAAPGKFKAAAVSTGLTEGDVSDKRFSAQGGGTSDAKLQEELRHEQRRTIFAWRWSRGRGPTR